MGKTAIITGITGQDGAYLSKLLLSKGYAVHGVKRRSSLFNTARIDGLFDDLHGENPRFFLHDGDLTDTGSLTRVIRDTRPDEIYNLAAQSHVKVSFDTPEYTANADGIGTLRILEALRILGMERHTRFYQASTSELYGKAAETPQSETTPFHPRSPYAAAKLYAYWITVNYREAYGMFTSNGILFNHESELRGETFVTRKITRAAARIARGRQDKLRLGNLSAKRDWGHSEDYVEAMWRILQHDKPDDFVIAAGEARSVREFAQAAFKHAGIDIEWKGEGLDEKGVNAATGDVLIEIDPEYFRPAEVEILLGNPSKAERVLGWRRKVTFDELARRMVEYDLRLADKEQSMSDAGFDMPPALEDR